MNPYVRRLGYPSQNNIRPITKEKLRKGITRAASGPDKWQTRANCAKADMIHCSSEFCKMFCSASIKWSYPASGLSAFEFNRLMRIRVTQNISQVTPRDKKRNVNSSREPSPFNDSGLMLPLSLM